jgi:hypothetical protein
MVGAEMLSHDYSYLYSILPEHGSLILGPLRVSCYISDKRGRRL